MISYTREPSPRNFAYRGGGGGDFIRSDIRGSPRPDKTAREIAREREHKVSQGDGFSHYASSPQHSMLSGFNATSNTAMHTAAQPLQLKDLRDANALMPKMPVLRATDVS